MEDATNRAKPSVHDANRDKLLLAEIIAFLGMTPLESGVAQETADAFAVEVMDRIKALAICDECEACKKALADLQAQYDALEEANALTMAAYKELTEKHSALVAAHAELKAAYDKLLAEHEALMAKYAAVLPMMEDIRDSADAALNTAATYIDKVIQESIAKL